MVNTSTKLHQALHAPMTDGVHQKCSLGIKINGRTFWQGRMALALIRGRRNTQLVQAALQNLHHSQAGEFAHGVWLAPPKRSLFQTHASRETLTTPTPFK